MVFVQRNTHPALFGQSPSHVPSPVPQPDFQWCGDSEGEKESLEDRLMDFATVEWGNRAFLLMAHSILCEPEFELCDPDRAVGKLKSKRRLLVVFRSHSRWLRNRLEGRATG